MTHSYEHRRLLSPAHPWLPFYVAGVERHAAVGVVFPLANPAVPNLAAHVLPRPHPAPAGVPSVPHPRGAGEPTRRLPLHTHRLPFRTRRL
eukprot:5079047-Pyramimonas_sp.AAC.1